MIEIGKIQFLKIIDEDKSGYYLTCEDKKEVFMPGSLVTNKVKIGDMIEVFVYLDNEGNDLATPTLPKAQVGEFACLKVKSVTPHGAFLDLGIPKDLLVPRKLQQYEMKVGEIHLVKILREEKSMRLFGNSKATTYVEHNSISKNQSVNIIPYHRTTLGYKVLIEKKYLGMVYHNEIFEDVVFGKEYKGSIKKIRENGQVDALLQEVGLKGIQANSEKILEEIKSNNGHLNLSDKSSPEEIEEQLNISKSAFKKAVGILYKSKKITLGKGCIQLIS
jgi:uncharacterized protein